jgi:hypothetical protein
MTDGPQSALHAELRRLADVAPPADLASAALRRATRNRRRAVASVLAAVVGAVAIIGGATVGVRAAGNAGSTTPAVTAPAPTGPAMVVTTYSTVAHGTTRTYLLDPRTGQYALVPYEIVLPSPDGSKALVLNAAAAVVSWRVISRDDLLAGRVDRARPLPPTSPPTWPAWTADGRAVVQGLVVDRRGKAGAQIGGFQLVDAATLRARVVRLEGGPYGQPGTSPSSDQSQLEPGAEIQVVVGPDHTPGSNGVGSQVWLFDLDGRLVRHLRTSGPVGGWTAWVSPGRRYLLSTVNSPVLDLGTARYVPLRTRPAGAVGWYDATHCVLQAGDQLLLVDVTTGRTVHSLRLPKGATGIQINRAAAYGPRPGQLVF